MPRGLPDHEIAATAQELVALIGTGRQRVPYTAQNPAFTLDDAYRVAARVRASRESMGERVVGRKIGFTNRTVWSDYGIASPIWNYMFDTTVSFLGAELTAFSVAGLPEPRIEPEIVFNLAKSPRVGMSDQELLGCVEWVAHGFEIVFSIFPDWHFGAADAVAAYGVHAHLFVGPQEHVSEDPDLWIENLSRFTVALDGGGQVRHGHARNVLGGPLESLRFLMKTLEDDPRADPIRPGELVTTGTLTEAPSLTEPGLWSTELAGVDLPGIRLLIDV